MSRHLAGTVSKRRIRDLFQKTYWAKCWYCKEERGPSVTKLAARSDGYSLELEPCPARATSISPIHPFRKGGSVKK
jgi:hypothetical protein